MIVEKIHINLWLLFFGISANKRTVSIVKITVECPDGKLLFPHKVFPTITKLLLSNITAGLGMANIFFSEHDIDETKMEIGLRKT